MIQTQAYATSVLATLRKGVTKLQVAGYAASAYVLHPTDWEGVELALSSTNAVEHLFAALRSGDPAGCSASR